MTIETEVQKLAVDARVTLFQLDLSIFGGGIVYWTNNSDVGQQVGFGGQTYVAVPMDWEGFDRDGKGPIARPTIRISNVANLVTNLLQTYQNLQGATVTRLRTFAKYLDGHEEADGDQILQRDVYRISRKSSQNKVYVEWELRAAVDVDGVIVPKGRLVRTCQARYRRWNGTEFVYDETSAACPYTGLQAFDINDQPTTPPNDVASKRLRCCEVRFGANNILPFGGMPGAGRVK